tara:strand:- start:2447 stop:2974 length:528 start_codon:yes stop_codon:yes gene_type:complete
MTYLSNITDKEKFEDICDLTTQLVGIRKGSLAFKSRKLELQIPRLVAANIGRLSFIHQRVIADVLNRDRSLIYHYEHKHGSNYASWREYREMFNKVYTAYNEINGAKTTFDDSKTLKRHLLDFTEEDRPQQVEILVKSGKVGCSLKTSYRQFSNMLKNIRFALTDYNHSLEVNLL